MKQSLQLRLSQHLALTPQLQQSIRLLQLSTLELAQEVEQMLDDNPFLEQGTEEAPQEEFGLRAADTPAAPSDEGEAVVGGEPEAAGGADDEPPSWEGDGSTELVPDDGEWGGEAPAARRNNDDDGEMDATELARSGESLHDHLQRQALSLRLSEEDRAALRYLIESLNDDGYLEESIESLAAGLAPHDLEEQEELAHRFTMALGLLQSLDPAGVGARNLAECLTLQLRGMQKDAPADGAIACALSVCRQWTCWPSATSSAWRSSRGTSTNRSRRPSRSSRGWSPSPAAASPTWSATSSCRT